MLYADVAMRKVGQQKGNKHVRVMFTNDYQR